MDLLRHSVTQAELPELIDRERSVPPGRQPVDRDPRLLDADQAHHHETRRFAQTPDLPVAPLLQMDSQPSVVVLHPHQLHLGRTRRAPIDHN